jgi:hypothetical protein
MENLTDVFDGSGRIRTDIDPASIPPTRRAAFTALLEAQARCRQAEADETTTVEKVERLVRVYADANARVPRQTHVELVKETFKLV